MKHVNGLLIKFVVVTAILWAALGGYGVSIGNILLVSTLLTGVLFIGDLFMLSRLDNLWSSIADFGLAFVVIWGMGTLLLAPEIPILAVSLISAFVISFAEYPLHLYMAEQVLTVKHSKSHDAEFTKGKMLTEFGAEIDIKKPGKEDEDNL